MTEPLVPVTVIGGYLGAGKTTVIAQLLRHAGGRRLAVLVNDFGQLNLDAALLDAATPPGSGPEIRELTNGCVCCSMADALGDGLDAVLALDRPPEQIIIEASGVADPAKIAAYGRGWPGVRLDAVVVVVDAAGIRQLAEDKMVGGTVRRQLGAADLLALSHLDGLTAQAGDEAASWLEAEAPSVPRIALDHGLVEPAVVLDVATSSEHRPVSGADAEVPDRRFTTITLAVDRPVDRDQLLALVESWPPEVVRVKGVVIGPGATRWLVQRVGRRTSIEPAPSIDVPSALIVILAGATPDTEVPSAADLLDWRPARGLESRFPTSTPQE